MKIFACVATIALGLIIASCNNSTPHVVSHNDPVAAQPLNRESTGNPYAKENAAGPQWLYPLMDSYFHYTQNELIRSNISENGDTSEGWMIDGTEITDTAKWFIIHIGHDMAEPDGSDQRFVTDGWIHVDTTTKQIYEYDVANDTLTKWVNDKQQ